MKKISLIILSIFFALNVFGQGQINTKSFILQDFKDKITKFVETGNIFFDQVLKAEVNSRWYLSPYEFCSVEDFNFYKEKEDYYFILLTENIEDDSQTFMHLRVLRGGKEAKDGIEKMFEVTNIVLCPANNEQGRELVYLPAFIDYLQQDIEGIIQKRSKFSKIFSFFKKERPNLKNKEFYFAKSDIDKDLESSDFQENNIQILDSDQVDSIFQENRKNAICSYTIRLKDESAGSSYYKFLIGADDKKIYYFKKFRITKKHFGFTKKEIIKLL